ncbi:MAG: TRAP transporter TatT component family protein [Candidatus Omnitrophica bacterium]|nr:TRAP transporter TatT component family protein [Candidatus Omnitrophota bacterium]
MKRIFLSLFFCFVLWPSCLLAADWKVLHERADRTGLIEAKLSARNNPASEDDLYILGLVYFNMHRDNDARDAFNEILRSNPGSIKAKWGEAEFLRRSHELGEAERALLEIIKTAPEFWPAYISLAYVRFIKTDFDGSVRLSEQVLRQGRGKVDLSNYVRAHLLLAGSKGVIAHFGGLVSKLINGVSVYPNLEKAENLKPESAEVKFGMGAFYLLAPPIDGGNINEAEKYLQDAIKLDKYFADPYVRLAQVYGVKGDKAKYEEYLNKALEIDPLNELALDVKSGRCRFICVGR